MHTILASLSAKRLRELIDVWMTCDFTFYVRAFQSYQNTVRMIMKGIEPFMVGRVFTFSGS